MDCITLGVAKSQTRLSLSLCLEGPLSRTNLSFCLLSLLLHMTILLLALQGITYYKAFSDIVAGKGTPSWV